jgi:Ca2+-binding RTX toxin-like protein
MRGGGRKTIIGNFNLQTPMTEIGRSSSGGTTKITYRFLDDSGGNVQPGDRLVGLTFSLDPNNPTEQSLGGITKVSLKKDGNYYVAAISLSQSSTVSSVDSLPPPSSSTLATYKVVGGTPQNDSLFGSSGNDVLIGGDGNDRLKAYGGIRAEVDILTGGNGADTFVLGDLNAQRRSDFGASYQGSGHAIITDFDQSSDQIQLLRNNLGDYKLKLEDKHIGSASLDTTIAYKGDLIAYIQDVDLTSLSANLATNPAFTFV